MIHMSTHWGIIGLLLIGIPFSQIVFRAGYSRWWILAIVLPGINLILLWIFAFADWPRDKGRKLIDHE